MIDIGLTKLALIGVVALVVVGPKKLPTVARMAGSLLGRAQRYINQVKPRPYPVGADLRALEKSGQGGPPMMPSNFPAGIVNVWMSPPNSGSGPRITGKPSCSMPGNIDSTSCD